MFKTILKSSNAKSGFSLVEVVVSLAVMTAGSMALMKFAEQQTKAQKSNELRGEKTSFTTEFKTYLAKEENCTASISGIGTPVFGSPVSLTQIKNPSGVVRYKVGDIVAGGAYSINDLKIEVDDHGDYNLLTYLALTDSGKRRSAGLSDSAFKTRIIMMGSGAARKCYSNFSAEAWATQEKICRNFLQGSFNSLLGTCEKSMMASFQSQLDYYKTHR